MRPFPPPPPAFSSFSSSGSAHHTSKQAHGAPTTTAREGSTVQIQVPGRSRRATAAFDDLFADILDALASSGLESDGNRTIPQGLTHPARSTTASFEGGIAASALAAEPVPVHVHGELKKLKHSISERNLNQSQRYLHDSRSIDRLLLAHRREQAEHARLKAELAAERELTHKLLKEREVIELRHRVEVEAMNKANRRAIQVLMGLQKEEMVSWAREELEPHLDLIDIGVRRRIANWERGKRDSMLKKRDSNIPGPASTHPSIPKYDSVSRRGTYKELELGSEGPKGLDLEDIIGVAISKDSSPDEKEKPKSLLSRKRSSNRDAAWVTRRRSTVRIKDQRSHREKEREQEKENRHPYAGLGVGASAATEYGRAL